MEKTFNPISDVNINDAEVGNLTTDNADLMAKLVDLIFWRQDHGLAIPS